VFHTLSVFSGFGFRTGMSIITAAQNIARTTSCRLHFASTRTVTYTTSHTAIHTRTRGCRTTSTTWRWKAIRSFSVNY